MTGSPSRALGRALEYPDVQLPEAILRETMAHLGRRATATSTTLVGLIVERYLIEAGQRATMEADEVVETLLLADSAAVAPKRSRRPHQRHRRLLRPVPHTRACAIWRHHQLSPELMFLEAPPPGLEPGMPEPKSEVLPITPWGNTARTIVP